MSTPHTTIDAPASTTPTARGPLSAAIIDTLATSPEAIDPDRLAALPHLAADTVAASADPLADDDVQFALFCANLVHYGPLEWAGGDWEWQPQLIETRTTLERAVEQALRAQVTLPDRIPTTAPEMAALLFDLTNADGGPPLSKWFSRNATPELLREFLIQRSIYTLREADPHSWGIARLRGRAKVALVEIQSDEYGGGRPDQMHATIFAGTMAALGLDTGLDHYLDEAATATLASFNTMTLFGLNRRLRGAIAGHLAAFEMTSSIPNRLYGEAFRRNGFGPEVTWYFDEHVEADAVHEQIAAHDLAGALAEDEPELAADVVFGAAACLYVDGRMAQHMYDAWTEGRSAAYAGEPDA